MTVQTASTITSGAELSVPLNRLKASPKNARRTPHSSFEVETLAASIAAKGLLQPPVVERERNAAGAETGHYLVTIGEGRRQALRLLAKRKVIGKAAPVRCLLDETNDAFEISLDENVTRFAMHPADQFEAFHVLAEQQGRSAEEIATRFGVTAHLVRQRLRLAAVSPKLIAAYREQALTLEQLSAFTLCEDAARQEQVYEQLAYNRSAAAIRRLLTEHEVEARDGRAVLVGAEAYQAAGGHIRRDLFAEDAGGWFEDIALLDRLALEKLTAHAEAIRAQEGWRWAQAYLDYPHDHGLGRVYPLAQERDETAQARLDALADEYDALLHAHEAEADFPPEVEARLTAIDAELEAASTPVYPAEAYERGGLFAVLQHDGSIRVERGLIRAEDAPSMAEEAEADDPVSAAAVDAGPSPTKAKPLSESLIADLTAHRTAALRDQLANQPEAAFVAALHVVVLQVFHHSGVESCLELHLHRTSLVQYAAGYEASPAGQAIAARHERWAARLGNAEDLWGVLCGLDGDERLQLFAHCVSLSVNAVKLVGRSRRTLGHADRLAQHLSLDIAAYWQATPDSYFGRVSKAQILADVSEATSIQRAQQLEGMKKDAMAKAAADLIGSEGWVPPLMKGAAVPPA